MNRDELESACWHHWPAGTPGAAAAVDAILRAADDYATDQAAAVLAGAVPVLQEHRRAVLELATRQEEKRELAPCGTWSAYRRHLRRCEPVDDACRKAARAEKARWRAARKAREAAA